MARHWHVALLESAPAAADEGHAFDVHLLACILGVAFAEVEAGTATLAGATGLDIATLDLLLADVFPGFEREAIEGFDATPPSPEIEEEMLRDLLLAHIASLDASRISHLASSDASGETVFALAIAPVLARLVARRALRPDHLWQDLGLYDRSELNRLLARHFPELHAGNTANMRWKKYFYRKLCEAEGFSLCSAPSCADCADFAECFGSEDGESRMAEHRRTLERTSPPLAAE